MAQTFELDDHRITDRYQGNVPPSARQSRSSSVQNGASRATRSGPSSRGADYDSFTTRTQVPAPTAEDFESLQGEIENLREVLNRMLDMIAEAAEERADHDRRAWLLNDRMGMVERRIHELEWSDGAAEMNPDMAAH